MAITTRDQLIDALGNNSSRIVIDKASIGNTVAGQYHSMWRGTGFPAQGAIPGAAAIPDHSTLGSIGFDQQTLPATSYLAHLFCVSSNSAMQLEIRDRVGHMGGLNGTLTTAQTVNLDLSTTGGGLSAARRGEADYSDIQWFLEWYTDTGATASNATVNVIYDDASTGNLALIAVGGTVRASRMIPLVPAVNGRQIRGVNNLQLSASTVAAGNFGVTATRMRAPYPMPVLNLGLPADWSQIGLPEMPNGTCGMINVIASATNTGSLRGGGKIAHG
jgi:hypothetical protein